MSFDILIEHNSHYVVGIGPFPPDSPTTEDYLFVTVEDDNLYEQACADGAKFNPLTKEFEN